MYFKVDLRLFIKILLQMLSGHKLAAINSISRAIYNFPHQAVTSVLPCNNDLALNRLLWHVKSSSTQCVLRKVLSVIKTMWSFHLFSFHVLVYLIEITLYIPASHIFDACHRDVEFWCMHFCYRQGSHTSQLICVQYENQLRLEFENQSEQLVEFYYCHWYMKVLVKGKGKTNYKRKAYFVKWMSVM